MDDIRVAVGPGDETKGRVRVFVNPGMEAGVDPINNPGQVGLEAGEHVGMVAGAGRIPILQSWIARILVKVDFAFNEHEDIRFDVDTGAAQSFHKAGHVATGVDDPFGAAVLQAADELLEVCGDGWVFELGKKRAVEVG